MKSNLIYIIVKVLLKVLSLFPVSVNHRLGSILGYLLYFSHSKSRRISEINISLCFPDLSRQERQQLLKNNMIELGKTMTELGIVWSWPVPKILDLIEVTGIEQAKQAIDNGKGVIILTPHLGCWEIAGLYMAQHLPMTTLYQVPKLEGVDKILRHVRSRSGAETVKADRKGMVQLLKALKSARATGILPDQTPKDLKSGEFAPFFGQQALAITLISSLVQKTDAQIFIGFAKRLENGKGYHFDLQSVDEAIAHEDPKIATATLNKEVEQLIKQAPEQYLWSYKRFKRVPDGQTNPYH